MALSNTAVPIYYGQFREQVRQGLIPVSEEISYEMNRTDAMIEDPRYYYDDKAINGFIEYCETELTLVNGQPLEMLESFKLWAESLLSWFTLEERVVWSPKLQARRRRVVKKRLRKKQFLIVARGAAKSMYAACLQSYFLNVDPTTTVQITTAPTMKQAEEVFLPIKTAITRARGPLFQFLTSGSLQNTTGSIANRQKLAHTKKGIENFMTGSILEIRPMSIDKLQGAQPKIVTIDEWLSGDTREDIVGAVEQGASKNEEYFIVAISSEGTVRNGSGDTIKMELSDILRGIYEAPHVSIWHYKLLDKSEVAYPELWARAQPNIGLTVSYSAYELDVERMEKAPSTSNDILAKRFGLPMAGTSYFFRFEETIPHNPVDFWGMACGLGADLSQGDDFCAFSFVFPLSNGGFGVKGRSYITELTLNRLPKAMRDLYDTFIAEGTLIIMPGITLDMDEVYEDLSKHIEEARYDIRCFGYDPYNARRFVELYTQDWGEHAVEKIAQGARTESVPLGEIKKFVEERLWIFDQQIDSYTMQNAVVEYDTNNNKKLSKMKRDEKIDNVSAAMDAYIAIGLNKDAF